MLLSEGPLSSRQHGLFPVDTQVRHTCPKMPICSKGCLFLKTFHGHELETQEKRRTSDFRHEPFSIVSPDSCLGLPTSSAVLHPAAVAAAVTRVQSVGTARSLGQFVSCRNEFTSDTRSFCIFYSLKRWDNCLSAS